MSGSTNDTLVLKLSEDYYGGDARFAVTVDGIDATPGANTVTQRHSANGTDGAANTGAATGLSNEFDIPVAPLAGGQAHKVAVTYTNDAYGGSLAADRNLYVDGITINGNAYSTHATAGTFAGDRGSSQELLQTGDTATYTVAASPAVAFAAAAAAGPPPTIAGLPSSESAPDNTSFAPYTRVTVTDANAGATTSATITLTSAGAATDANGLLSGNGLVKAGTGTYTLAAATPANLTNELRALRFTPTNHEVPPGGTVATTVGLNVSDGTSSSVASFTLNETAQNTAPTIAGLPGAQSGTDNGPVAVFATATVTDPDTGAATSAVITLTHNGTATDVDGTLSGTGLTHTGTGTYALAATSPANLTGELNALNFTPNLQPVDQGSTSSTLSTMFSLAVAEGGASTTASTTLTETAQNTPPTITGVPANQSGTDNAPLAVFASTTITDPDPGALDSATITLTANGTATDADGILSGSGLTHTGAGTYTLAAATPATLTSELDALRFVPTAQQVAPGHVVNTLFELFAGQDGANSSATSSVAVQGTACYCPGTLILTDVGEVAVEALQIGDRVVTRTGGARPIRWIGHRRHAARMAAGERTLAPVLIRAGALADGVPRRDLYVSPLHAMWLDGALIPAVALVNGISVLQPPVIAAVAYVHVELDSHDVILAEGAPSESFVDDRSRAMFDNAASYRTLYPDARPEPARYCAPRVEDGPLLQAARRRIAARARSVADAPAPAELLGKLDRVCRDRVEGWARDGGHASAGTMLRVSDNGVTLTEVRADRHREDLVRAGIGAGLHGFSWRIPGGLSPDVRHTIRIERAADGRELGGSPWVIEASAAPVHAV